MNDDARVDDQNNELDEDYSPLGGRPTLDGKFELMMFGANHAGDDYGRILNVWEDFTTLPEGNIHSHPVLASYADDAPWLWDTVSASQQSGAPQQRRHGCAGDLDGNGLDEVLLVHVENDNLLIDVVWDEEHGYAKEQYDVDGSSAVREIAIAAGDYDGDGACEIAVMMETADSGVLRMYDFVNGAFAHDHTVSLERTLAGSRMFVTMEFGNVDNDYRSEFAIVVNEHTPSQSTSHFRVLDDAEAGWSELIAGVSGSPDVASNDGYTVADLALGDIDGDGRDELVIERTTSNCSVSTAPSSDRRSVPRRRTTWRSATSTSTSGTSTATRTTRSRSRTRCTRTSRRSGPSRKAGSCRPSRRTTAWGTRSSSTARPAPSSWPMSRATARPTS